MTYTDPKFQMRMKQTLKLESQHTDTDNRTIWMIIEERRYKAQESGSTLYFIDSDWDYCPDDVTLRDLGIDK